MAAVRFKMGTTTTEYGFKMLYGERSSKSTKLLLHFWKTKTASALR
jgi:hypothetical protein